MGEISQYLNEMLKFTGNSDGGYGISLVKAINEDYLADMKNIKTRSKRTDNFRYVSANSTHIPDKAEIYNSTTDKEYHHPMKFFNSVAKTSNEISLEGCVDVANFANELKTNVSNNKGEFTDNDRYFMTEMETVVKLMEYRMELLVK